MPFELIVVSNTPMTPVHDLETVAIQFFTNVGYLPQGGDAAENVRESVPYKLLMGCFLARPEKAWTVEELIAHLETSRPTVYRHLNKLKALDLLEESIVKAEGEVNGRKAYRVRYGNLSKAWNFVEANVKVAMENYRKTIDHLHELALKQASALAAPKAAAKAGRAA